MNLLLDTQAWLWYITESRELSKSSVDLISSSDNRLFVSAISVWETAIKLALNKLHPVVELSIITTDPTIEFVPFEILHAMRVQHLPLFHHDPFDRALVAHAAHEGLTLVTSDKKLRLYQQEVRMIFC